jgi:hypothetical protein
MLVTITVNAELRWTQAMRRGHIARFTILVVYDGADSHYYATVDRPCTQQSQRVRGRNSTHGRRRLDSIHYQDRRRLKAAAVSNIYACDPHVCADA